MTIHPHSQAAQKHVHRADAAELPPLRMPQRPDKGKDHGGKYYRIEVRPREEFDLFRVRDMDKKGHLECLLGKREKGSRFCPVAWLVLKEDAHLSHNGRLVIDRPETRSVLKQITTPIVHDEGDFFHAKPKEQRRRNAS